jgi:hypothetical protein
VDLADDFAIEAIDRLLEGIETSNKSPTISQRGGYANGIGEAAYRARRRLT